MLTGPTRDYLTQSGASRVLVLGIAYKKNIDDLRESPALEIIRLLQERGADVRSHDPFCPVIEEDGHTAIQHLPLYSQPLTDETLEGVDAVVLITDHSAVDYSLVAAKARLVVDTRGTMRGYTGAARVVGLSGRELNVGTYALEHTTPNGGETVAKS